MSNIQVGKLLYHITDMDNLNSILEKGLLPRSELEVFVDIADSEIIEGRKKHKLEDYVPFHFFGNGPFDGRVQLDNKEKSFIYLTVRREYAKAQNWRIIPLHPLGKEEPHLLDYQTGIDEIDWKSMNTKNFTNDYTKRVCMAECLSPGAVTSDKLQSVFVKNDDDKSYVESLCKQYEISLHVNVQTYFFVNK